MFLSGDNGANEWQSKWVSFVVEEGFAEEQDVNEQFVWLKESEALQFDPDDPKGLRLPPGHLGRARGESAWSEKEQYFGRSFNAERLELDHFSKSLVLDSCPPFPDRMVHHEPTEDGRAPLYLPHISQSAPLWSLRKKMARSYGPAYLSQIAMPPMKLPNTQCLDAMLRRFVAQKAFKAEAVDAVHRMDGDGGDGKGADGDAQTLDRFLEEQRSNERVDGVDDGRLKMLGVGTPYFDERRDVVSRHFEVCDKVRGHVLFSLVAN